MKKYREYFLLQINGMLVVTASYVWAYNLLLPRDFPMSSSWQLELLSVVIYHSYFAVSHTLLISVDCELNSVQFWHISEI